MTQLDLPQISIKRYFDLLKRRRWQVIPVSLLGLLIGGLVAFFIPRYYVADATLGYDTPPGEEAGVADDPMFAIVDSALATVPLAIEPTVKALGWEEATIADPYVKTERLREIEGRLRVVDANPGKGRKYAKILMTFRDRDGQRAAEFLNRLVDTWIKQRIAILRENAEKVKYAATQRYKEQDTAWNQYQSSKSNLERRYRIDPAFPLVVQQAAYKDREAEQQRKRDALAAMQAAIVSLEQQLKQQEELLTTVPLRVKADAVQSATDLQQTPAVEALVKLILYYESALENQAASNPWRGATQKQIQKVKQDLAKLTGGTAADPEGMRENPERQKLAAAIQATELELHTKEQLLGPLQREVEAADLELPRLVEAYGEYDKVNKLIEETEKRLVSSQAALDSANSTLGKFDNQAPIKVHSAASPPPRPTEPNILLVALVGCVLGLGLAIALILLLDVMQGSFKTIDDVERGLPVPVLGGVSHLTTESERRESVRGRRRITLVTAAFVVLITGVVLLFYWDPTRLPPFVRDLLALVLRGA